MNNRNGSQWDDLYQSMPSAAAENAADNTETRVLPPEIQQAHAVQSQPGFVNQPGYAMQPPVKKKKKKRRFLKFVTFLLVLLLAIGGFFIWKLNQAFNEIAKIPDALPSGHTSKILGPQNILLLGSDSREDVAGNLDDLTGQRADTIMVIHIPASHDSIQVMSIMRDNWVTLPTGEEAKINAALAYGGVPMMVETVEDLIGTDIDRVAIIDFDGFSELSEALGGVTVNNPREFSEAESYFPEGEITLEGEDALNFVRSRYQFADGDYSRVENQQIFLASVMNQMLSKEVMLNPLKLQDSMEALAPTLYIDDQATIFDVFGQIVQSWKIRGSNVTFFTSPTLGTGWSADGQSVILPDWEEWEKLSGLFASDGDIKTYAEEAAEN